MTAAATRRPTAIVSYSHTEVGWSSAQAEERLQQVYRFVYALRAFGAIDADADIFHQNVDWTRWGPAQVTDSDFVLVIASPAWKDAWVAHGDLTKGKGVRVEADALRSVEAAGRPEFQKRVRLIMFPGSTDDDIPIGMHGIARHYLSGFDETDLEDLLRDLTDQPKFVKPSLGEVLVFPPAMTTHTPNVAKFETGTGDKSPAPTVNETSSTDPGERTERIEQLKAQLEALPDPLPGEGPHLPWFRVRQQVESQLFAELREATGAPAGDDRTSANSMPVVEWAPAANVPVSWADSLRRDVQYGSSAVVVHLVPVPNRPLSQRVMSSLDDAATRLVRDHKLVDDAAGINRSSPADGILIETDPVMIRGHEVALGRFLALHTGRSGQVSVWYTLPRDHMGSILDEQRLKHDIQAALGVGAAIFDVTYGDGVSRVAVAAELVNTTSLTGGTFEELGSRNQASMPGAFSASARMEADESVDVRHLRPNGSWSVAGVVAQVLIRAWNH